MLHLTREQSRTIDRRALEEFHIPGIVLMENAARAVVDEAVRLLDGECCRKILVLCGGGNNGGDGLAVARHLHNRGAEITIGLTVDPSKFTGDALINWKIATAMKLHADAFNVAMLRDAPPILVIDAIFGTGLSNAPREPFATLVAAVNGSRIPVVAVDLPSGMDCDTGVPLGSCIVAASTVTFAAEKAGFAHPGARAFLGHVVVGDIGCPSSLMADVQSAV